MILEYLNLYRETGNLELNNPNIKCIVEYGKHAFPIKYHYYLTKDIDNQPTNVYVAYSDITYTFKTNEVGFSGQSEYVRYLTRFSIVEEVPTETYTTNETFVVGLTKFTKYPMNFVEISELKYNIRCRILLLLRETTVGTPFEGLVASIISWYSTQLTEFKDYDTNSIVDVLTNESDSARNEILDMIPIVETGITARVNMVNKFGEYFNFINPPIT